MNLELERLVDWPITNLRWFRPTSLLHEDYSDNEVDSPHFQGGVQHDQTRMVEEFLYTRAFNELVQRRIEETKLQLCNRPNQVTAKVSDSLLSEEILECEYPKKFTTPTFECYSETSDPVQHIRHFQDKIGGLLSRSDPLICLTFPFSLKGVTSNWFYSMKVFIF